MSLIIEALKKARDDAVRRQAAARGLPLAPVPKLERKSRWLSFTLIPLAAALVVCVMLLFDVYSRIPDPQATAEPAFTAANSPDTGQTVVVPPAAGSAIADRDMASAEPIPAIPAQAGPASPRVSPSPDVSTSDSQSSSSSTTHQAPAADQAAVDERSASTTGMAAEGRVVAGQARLSGGQLVDLGGIAWSESDPYALINGQVVGVGELVRSYRVTAITPSEVILEKDDDRVVLRLE